jgi:cell division protein FtsB
MDHQRIGNDYHELVDEVNVLRQEKAELENVRDFALTDIFVEQQARLSLGFVRGDETAFVVIGKNN